MSIWIKNDCYFKYCLFTEIFQYLIPFSFHLASGRVDRN